VKENKQVTSGLTKKTYWDSIYVNNKPPELLVDTYKQSYKQYCDKLIMDKIIEFYNDGAILEVGAGNSDWMIRVINEFKPFHCTGLDYSEDGCRLLKDKSKVNNVEIDVIHADMFSPPDEMLKQFNFVMSFGVVEHFKDLTEVLGIISQFLKFNGVMFTLIPNMSGINGALARLWNKKIYDIHVPHDLTSFVEGHDAAGLDILWADYLGSSSFGVLSSCFQKHQGINYFIYKQLTRVSKILWLFESKIKSLPATKVFSPYILVISRVRD